MSRKEPFSLPDTGQTIGRDFCLQPVAGTGLEAREIISLERIVRPSATVRPAVDLHTGQQYILSLTGPSQKAFHRALGPQPLGKKGPRQGFGVPLNLLD